jgi:recombination protein RecT
VAIKEGELVRYDPLFEELEVDLIQDDSVREQTPTIGYYAMFEYLNGFRKTMYWSKEKMEAHALKYSQGYAADKRKGNAYTFWSKDFDGMAYKTMLRQLIGKWGVMSVDMQQAMAGDNATIVNGEPQYIDTATVPQTTTEPTQQTAEQPQTQNDTEGDFFGDAEKQNSAPTIEDESIMGEEYKAKNAAEKKAALLETLNKDMGVPLEKLESFVRKSYAQWQRKERLALINAIQQISKGKDPVTLFQKAA